MMGTGTLKVKGRAVVTQTIERTIPIILQIARSGT
jgi:hypothetical protein